MTSFSVSKVSVGVLNLLKTSFISPNPSDDEVDVLVDKAKKVAACIEIVICN